MTSVALIPARAGSKRVPGKNWRQLGGKPLFEWTDHAAVLSGCYDHIVLATDHPDCQSWPRITTGGNSRVPLTVFVRSPVSDTQPDLEWVLEVQRAGLLDGADTFSILRPTSPFRSAETIRRAWKQWEALPDYYDSMRAVRRVAESPYKMWLDVEGGLVSFYQCLTTRWDGEQYWNQPTQSLTEVYIQTAGIEIAHTRVLPDSISGGRIASFVVEGPEALDINTLEDWWLAERYLAEGLV